MSWKLMQNWSLKSKATLFTICIFLTGIWLLFFYASSSLQQDMAKEEGKHQLSVASLVATTIDQELTNRFDALRKTAKLIAGQLSKPDRLQAALEKQAALQYLFNGGIIVTGPDGTTIGDLPRSAGRLGTNYGNDAWVAAALHEGKSSISRPLQGKHLHAPVFGMTVPVLGADGAIIGSLGGVVDLARPNFLDGITKSGGDECCGLLLIAPQYRLIVTATDKQRIMEKLPQPGSNPGIDQMLTGEKASNVIVNSHGEEVLASAHRIPIAGWYVVISFPTAEVFAPIHNLQQRILLATLVVTLFAGLLAWWLLRWQLSPLTDTIETLASFSATERSLPTLPVSKDDEVGELIRAFNRLLETLNARNSALRESHENLRSILATTQDGYLRFDGQGRLLEVNATYCRLSGYSRQELLGLHISDLEAIEDETAVANHLQDVFQKMSDLFETQHRRKDGTIWDVEISTSYRVANGGQLFVFARDITERKQLEKARLTSQKMESLGTLASGISHDFNNILMIVRENARLATKYLETGHKASKNLMMIADAGDRGSELVRRILAFGRPSELQTDEVDLRNLVGDVLELLRPILPAAVSLRTKFAEEVPLITADSGQIQEAIVNLTTNAAYAIGKRTGAIEYRLEPVIIDEPSTSGFSDIDAGDYTLLTVSDNGAGMDAQTLERIFDAFYTTKPAGQGTGLGLAMVHKTMQSHGGRVKVESAPGQGTSFSLYFPAGDQQPVQKPQMARRQLQPPSEVSIMYVDDEESLAYLAAEELSCLGYRVSRFVDPDEALAAFRDAPMAFDVVVTDKLMPHMSGFELARKVLEQRPDIPVLLITGELSSEENRLAVNLGISKIINKPLNLDKLSHALALVMEFKE